jgi:hypothetical protein
VALHLISAAGTVTVDSAAAAGRETRRDHRLVAGVVAVEWSRRRDLTAEVSVGSDWQRDLLTPAAAAAAVAGAEQLVRRVLHSVAAGAETSYRRVRCSAAAAAAEVVKPLRRDRYSAAVAAVVLYFRRGLQIVAEAGWSSSWSLS